MTEITKTQQNPSYLPMSNPSRLVSEIVATKQDGYWGYTANGYDFIPTGGQRKVAIRGLSKQELEEITPQLSPMPFNDIKNAIIATALRKRISDATPATMPILVNGMAEDLQDFSALAVSLAMREIRCNDDTWFPKDKIVKIVSEWQDFVDDLYAKSTSGSSPSKTRKHRGDQEPEGEHQPATAEQKAAVAKMMQDFFISVGAA